MPLVGGAFQENTWPLHLQLEFASARNAVSVYSQLNVHAHT